MMQKPFTAVSTMRFTKRHTTLLWFVGLILLSSCSPANQPPTVKITAPQAGTPQGSLVSFHAEASDSDGHIQRYRWSFGDGTTSEEPQPTHTYARSGQYRVELVVTDDRGATAHAQLTLRVQVGPQAIASLRAPNSRDEVLLQHITGETPLVVVFDSRRSTAEPGAQIIRWEWDFADGQTSTDPNPTHIYTQSGDYQPLLTVTDDRGRTSEARLSVRVVSYEAYEGTVEADGVQLHYRLEHKDSKVAAPGISMLYWYVVEGPRQLTENELQAVFEDIIQKARQRPRVIRITVQLFDQQKKNFMVSGDYDHYLGSAVWDGAEPEERAFSFTFNRAYLQGRAITVYGYEIREDLLRPGDPDCGARCDSQRIAVVDITLQEQSFCRSLLLTTLREIARRRLSAEYDGFLVNLYAPNVTQPIGWALGLRGPGLTFPQLPIRKLVNPPSQWDVRDPSLWIRLGSVPSC
jgi:hypothetical protein